MLRKIALCLLIVAVGVLMYPDVSARERDPVESTVVHGSIVRAALKDITTWIVAPKDWRLSELLNAPPRLPELSTTEPVQEVPAARPEFRYSDLVLKTSDKYDMDWRLVASVIAVESSFNPRAVSPKGARGLMQLMPTTAAIYRVKSQELFDPGRNLEAGVQHLKWLNERYSGNLEKVLAAYNSGEGAVDRYRGVPPFRPTRFFVRRVMSRYQNHLTMFPDPSDSMENGKAKVDQHPAAAY